MKKLFFAALMLPVASACFGSSAATFPTIHPLPSGTHICQLSNNGNYGISQSGSETDEGELLDCGGEVWDIKTMTSKAVSLPESGVAAINDITDDGNLIVGSCDGMPATYSVTQGKWTTLPLPGGTNGGVLLAVTPDGSRAVGLAYVGDEWHTKPAAYDLTTGKLQTLKNLPSVDMDHQEAEINRFCAISPDGRYIVGRLSEHILLPVSMCAYVYDTQTDKVSYIGFTPNSSRPWTPDYKYTHFIDHVHMSANGKYLTGAAYIIHEDDANAYGNEYYAAFTYDVATGKIEVFDGPYDADIAGFGITDSGNVLASVPAVNPYASMAVRSGEYFYRLDEIYPDFYSRTGLSNTGKPVANSADGRVVSMLTSTTDSYIMVLDQDWNQLCSDVNLLADYTVSPLPGAYISSLSEISLRFTRNIELAGAAQRIVLKDSTGKTIATATGASVKDATLTATFREQQLTPGEHYTVSIREGLVAMTGDALVASNEINIEYVGRRSGPVAPANVNPANNSSFARLDASTSYITVSFDSEIMIAQGAAGELWRQGESAPFTDLVFSQIDPKTIAVFPAYRQYLYDGTDYRVIIPAGSVTDLSGKGDNDEIILEYSGNYVREVSANDRTLFADDFVDYSGFMFYDGDQLPPAQIPAGWGFTAQTPWALVRESTEATKMALAAHSMFSTPGQADDWAVTPQLFIPDSRCYLKFEAQSYLNSKTDILKVYAYVSENGFSTLSKSIVDDIKANGDLIFSERLLPGRSEEGFEGDWETYLIDLAAYAGKNLYLAFVNDNENQSAVMLNSVEVIHDLQYLTTITTPESVVKATEAAIEGEITITGDMLEISQIELTLRSGNNEISKQSASNLSLKKGNRFNFAFPDKLPLNPGVVNRYTVDILINNTDAASYNFAIKNLEFSPERKVVIEEYSGSNCSNCPLGFLAMENLERTFPGAIIPIVIRTYTGDPLGSGLEDYSAFTGLELLGAPSGLINRTTACFPMVSGNNTYYFSGQGLTESEETDPVVWLDEVSALMQTAPDGEVEFTATLAKANGTITLEGNTRFAINGSSNVALFGVLLENERKTVQANNFYTISDPVLGSWGAGGVNAKSRVGITIDHVARQTYGASFNGTSALVPANQVAGTSYPFSLTVDMPDNIENDQNLDFVVMMINSDTDRVINAARAKVSVESAIEEVLTNDSSASVSYYDLQGRSVSSPRKSQLLIRRQGSKASKIIF